MQHTWDISLIPGSGRSPGEGNSNPLQYSCLGDTMDRGAWRATVHGVAKESDTAEQLSVHTHIRKSQKERVRKWHKHPRWVWTMPEMRRKELTLGEGEERGGLPGSALRQEASHMQSEGKWVWRCQDTDARQRWWEGNSWKARGLQMEEIGCKCQTSFISLLSGRRKQTSDTFFPLVYTNLKRGFS